MRKPKPFSHGLLFLLAAAALGGGLPGCLSDGGGSDTETITGTVLNPDGGASVGAKVKLIPSDFDPSQPGAPGIPLALTDAAGRYRLAVSPSPGKANTQYNLLITGQSNGFAAFASALPSRALPETLQLAKARVLLISMHASGYSASDSGEAFFPGTDILVHCNGRDTAKVENVPSNLMRLILESRAGWRHDYQVSPLGDTLLIQANSQGVISGPP